nr:MAG TPA: hypothetical protein [Caudoviricetes sp.]
MIFCNIREVLINSMSNHILVSSSHCLRYSTFNGYGVTVLN